MPRTAKTWHLQPHDPDALRRLAEALGASPILAQLLYNRGVSEPAAARRFLDSPLTGLHAPSSLPCAVEAADRLLAAVRSGRPICVYGDYDVDGVSGTALLVQGLRLAGASRVDFYVPHRLEEGYGLNVEALRQIQRSGASLVVTVDCGITSVVEAAEARRLGLELIVTDHHEPAAQLPDADVLVHPRLPDGSYPFHGLSGSAVAFKVAWALCQRECGSDKVTARYRDYLLEAVGLAALGIVADVVPLADENRILVRAGLGRLRQSALPGVRALLQSVGLGNGAPLRASDVGFKLGPRLNAAGRLGCARMVVDLLTTSSAEKATDLVRYLEQQNEDRQKLERRIFREACELVETQRLDAAPALVLASAEWHAGIVGIVASRLVERYARPVLLIALQPARPDAVLGEIPPVGRGSGRSVPGFDLHKALAACGEHLLAHGGHQAAVGLRLHPECINAFREAFCAHAERQFQGPPPPPRLVIDTELPLATLTFGLMKEIEQLEPYGAGNERPLFLAGGLEVVGTPRRMGQGDRHLSFRVQQSGTQIRAVAWGMGERLDELMAQGGRCCLVFTPRINEWQGYRSVEIEVIDFQAGPVAQLVG